MKQFKVFTDDNPGICEISDSLYDRFTNDDIMMMFSCVETEAYGGSFAGKVNVANVILNRVNDPNRWANTLTGVITGPGQFTYGRLTISDETRLACEYAYLFPDTTQGAEYFNKGAPDISANAGLVFIFEDELGHKLYNDP